MHRRLRRDANGVVCADVVARHRLRLPCRRGRRRREANCSSAPASTPDDADHAERHVAAGSVVVDRGRSCAPKLLGARHDVIFLAGHFSANSALAADFSTSLLTTELAASTVDFTNSIVFSAGCHSGYNIVDSRRDPGVTQPLDWAQAFARKRRDADRRHRLPVRRHRLPRVQRAALRQLRAPAARRHRRGRDRRGARQGQARLPRHHARHPRHPREGAARGDAVRPADARRQHAVGPRRSARATAPVITPVARSHRVRRCRSA